MTKEMLKVVRKEPKAAECSGMVAKSSEQHKKTKTAEFKETDVLMELKRSLILWGTPDKLNLQKTIKQINSPRLLNELNT